MTISVATVNGDVRFLLGGLPTSVLSDEVLNKIIQKNIDKYGDTDDKLCVVTYYSLMDALLYLINQSAQGSGGISGGAVTERSEQKGRTKITVKYSPDTAGKATGWEALYERYKADPSLIGCNPFPPTPDGGGSIGSVIIGGVSNAEFDRVRSNPDSRNGYSMGYNPCNIRNKWGRNGY